MSDSAGNKKDGEANRSMGYRWYLRRSCFALPIRYASDHASR